MGEYLISPNLGGSALTSTASGNSAVGLDVNLISAISVTATNSANYSISGLLSNAGSLTLMGAERAGSVYPLRLDIGSYLMIAGSISSMPTISVTTGSEVYVKAGSIEVWTGSIYLRDSLPSIGSYTTQMISGLQWSIGISGAMVQGTTPWVTSGTSTIAGSAYVTGSINQGTTPWMVSGLASSVGISGAVNQGTTPWGILGSVRLLGVSGADTYAIASTSGTSGGFLRVDVTTSPVPVSGIVNLGSVWAGTGSVFITQGQLSSIGSLSVQTISGTITVDNRVAGSIVNMPIVGISGTVVGVSGIVNQGTTPWGILGSVRLLGVSGVDTYAIATTSGTSGGFLRIDVTNNPVPISGITNQGTSPWITLGSSYILSTPGSIGVFAGANTIFGISGAVVGVSGIVNLGSARYDIGSYLMVAGSISSMPSVTATSSSDYKISGPWVGIGSLAFVGGDFNGSVYPLKINIGSYLMVAGSISSMPSISVTEGAAYKPSGLITDNGSVYLVGGERAGSIWPLQIVGGSYLLIAGSISSMPSVSATSSSDYKVSGTWTGIGSASLVAGNFNGSVYPLFMEGGSQLLVVGSVRILSDPVPVSGIVNQGTNPWITLGSSYLLSTPGSHGVFAGVNTIFGVSGTVVGISGVVNQGTNPWGVIGSTRILGVSGADVYPLFTASGTSGGILFVNVNSTAGVGSSLLISTAGSIGVYAGANTIFGISGTVVGISGIVNQGTTPWAVSGNALGVSGTAFQQVWVGTGSIVVSGTAVVAPSPGSNFTLSSPGSIGVFAGANTIFGISGTVVGISGVVNPTPGSVYHLSSLGSHGVFAGVNTIFGISGTVVGVSGVVNQGTSPWAISGLTRTVPTTYDGSIMISSGTIQLGSAILTTLLNTINWIGVRVSGNSPGSIYAFKIADSQGYPIHNYLQHNGDWAFLSPIVASGVLVYTVSGTTSSGTYHFRTAYY